jgi:hypothetical protein
VSLYARGEKVKMHAVPLDRDEPESNQSLNNEDPRITHRTA